MLVDDQLEQKEATGAINGLAKGINSRDTKEAISYIARFDEIYKDGLNKNKQEKDVGAPKQILNPEDLLRDIRSDMGDER